jgi:hypothetical protein
LIDVGHTPDGIRQSLASLAAIHGADDWILVTGASRDKKADEIVGALAPSFDAIICTAAHHKGADAQDIAAAAARANPKADIRLAATIAMRFVSRGNWPAAKRRKIYVAGGLFLAIEYAGGRARGPCGRFEVLLAVPVMAGLVPAIHAFLLLPPRRGCPGQARNDGYVNSCPLAESSIALNASSSCGEIETPSFSPVWQPAHNHLL